MKKKNILFFLCCFLLMYFVSLTVLAEESEVIPVFNPSGDIADYSKAIFKNDDQYIFSFNSNNSGETFNKSIHGVSWYLEMKVQEKAEKPFDEFREYLGQSNVKKLYEDKYKLYFTVSIDDSEEWWVYVENRGSQYNIKEIRKITLLPGKNLKFKLNKENDTVSFYTYQAGNYYDNLKINISGGNFRLSGSTSMEEGKLSKYTNYQKDLNGEYDRLYNFFDIPQGKNIELYWELSKRAGKDDSMAEVDVNLEQIFSLPELKLTEQPGALKVVGVNNTAEVVPADYEKVTHKDLKEFRGDATADGDMLFWLPAGLWNVRLKNNIPGIEYIQSSLIPVNSGEITEVYFPEILTEINKAGEKKNIKIKTGLNIQEVVEDGDIVTTRFSLYDPEESELKPTLENTTLKENGREVEIEEIRHLNTPASIVLLLDSSGSMKGQMADTLETARKFIDSLPDETNIRVIDFDTRPKKLKGSSKEEVLYQLNMIKADGATALYDSILEGLKMLKDVERPSLLVLTDGVDANWDDSGPGSKASREELINAVAAAEIPLYTIGFGANHDKNTLGELAQLSHGLYNSAQDQSALDNIFTKIKNDLGNTYQLSYKRPAIEVLKDLPLVSIAIDTSGSMIPSRGGILQKVKNIFYDFILKLPEETMVQLQHYDVETYLSQVLTSNKAAAINALGRMKASGNNDTFATISTALETSKSLSSSKKILIYVSDQDLGLLNNHSQQEFDDLLKKFKKENIDVLWVGFCMDDVEDIYKNAAEMSGGKYIISEDPAVLAKEFDKIISEVSKEQPVSDRSRITMTVNNVFVDGYVDKYSDSRNFKLSMPGINEKEVKPDGADYLTGLPFQKFSNKAAEQFIGDNFTGEDILVQKDIPLGIEGSNQAVTINASEALLLNKLGSISPPQGQQFMVLLLKMKNILPEQEVIVYPDGSNHPASWVAGNTTDGKKIKMIPSYLIPDMTSHMFLNWNNERYFQLEPASYLAEEPLLIPGRTDLTVEAGKDLQGALVFLIPDEPLKQVSLHYYDTKYGHITMPLVGEIKKEEISLEKLPETQTATLSDTFSLNVDAVKDLNQIETIEAEKNTIFRVVDGTLTSRVQALLDINPLNHLYFRLPTEKGPLYTEINSITQLLPFGFIQPAVMAPGSDNKFRLAYQIPASLAEKEKGELFVELGDGDIVIPLGDSPGKKEKTQETKQKENGALVKGDMLDISVNALAPVSSNILNGYGYVVADITFFDKEDGYASKLLNGFELIRDDYQGKAISAKSTREVEKSKGLGGFSNNKLDNEYLLRPDKISSEIIAGYDNNTVIYDGTARRSFIIFKIPQDGREHEWTLESKIFPELKYKLSREEYSDDDLLVRKKTGINPYYVEDYYQEVREAVNAVIREYRAMQTTRENQTIKKVSLDPENSPEEMITVPPMTIAGLKKFSEINNLKELITTLEGLKWLPNKEGNWKYRFSPDAVLSQGWGTEVEFAMMTEKILLRMGYDSERRLINLTGEGKKVLSEKANIKNIGISSLPALYYKDQQNKEHLLVFPFMKDFKELDGLVTVNNSQNYRLVSDNVGVEVILNVIPRTVDRNQQLKNLGNALAGSETGVEPQEIRVLSEFIPLDTLSKDAIDLGYTIVGRDNGDLYTAVIDTASGRIIGKGQVDTGLYKIISEKIVINGSEKYIYENNLDDGEEISGEFHTIGINLPDLNNDSIVLLRDTANKVYQQAANPDELSALKWYSRNILYSFIYNHSQYEQELADKLGLTIGRNGSERCIFVTISKNTDEDRVITSIDLLNVINQVHNGEKTNRSAFNIFSGIYASSLEAEVLPGDHIGLGEIWQQLPEGTHLVLINRDNIDEIIEYMEDKLLPERIIKYVKNLGRDNVILIPNNPALINGREYWACLDINTRDYKTISILGSGEHGALVESLLGNWSRDGVNYIVGAFKGVDTSIWAVSAFSLELEDNEKIMQQAKELALGLANNFSVSQGGVNLSIGGTPNVGTSLGPISANFDLIEKKGSIQQNVLSFSDGYKAGVELYFKKME